MIIFGILDSEMELPMTLKKSTDRLLYLIGMAVTFLGLLVPYCRTTVLETVPVAHATLEAVTVSDTPAQEADDIEVTEFSADDTVIVDENSLEAIEDADNQDLLAAETEEANITEADSSDVEVEEVAATETIEIERTAMLNIISGASYFNQPGIAYISTFIVIVWLAALVGVILYFAGNFVVVDFIVWLIGAAFGIAHTIAMAMYCYDNDYALFGWIFIGSCLAFVGMTVALVGLIISIKNIQHPLAEKAA